MPGISSSSRIPSTPPTASAWARSQAMMVSVRTSSTGAARSGFWRFSATISSVMPSSQPATAWAACRDHANGTAFGLQAALCIAVSLQGQRHEAMLVRIGRPHPRQRIEAARQRLDRRRGVVMPDGACAERRRLRGHAVLHPEARDPGDIGEPASAGPGSPATTHRGAGNSRACRRRCNRAATGCRRSMPPAFDRSPPAGGGYEAIPGIHALTLPWRTIGRAGPHDQLRLQHDVVAAICAAGQLPQQEANRLGAQGAFVAAQGGQRWLDEPGKQNVVAADHRDIFRHTFCRAPRTLAARRRRPDRCSTGRHRSPDGSRGGAGQCCSRPQDAGYIPGSEPGRRTLPLPRAHVDDLAPGAGRSARQEGRPGRQSCAARCAADAVWHTVRRFRRQCRPISGHFRTLHG